MTVITAPHVLNPSTDLPANLALLNDNFDKIISDIGGLSPEQFQSSNLLSTVLTAGSQTYGTFTAVELPSYNSYASMIPEMTLWIDTFQIDTQWPHGTALSAAQKKMFVSTFLRITPDPTAPPIGAATRPLGTFVYNIINLDSSSHTIIWFGSGIIFKKVEGSV